MNLDKANENVKTQIKIMALIFGSQRKLAMSAGINDYTLCRKLQDPGQLTLAELRKIAKIAQDKGIPFNPLEVLP